jgi:hypothetical protein
MSPNIQSKIKTTAFYAQSLSATMLVGGPSSAAAGAAGGLQLAIGRSEYICDTVQPR